jgi:5'-phosphate synthase pdxT subunit
MSKSTVTIGILAVQGDVLEHEEMMTEVLKEKELDHKIVRVRRAEEISELDGLIIPGGESTVMSRFSSEKIAEKTLKQTIQNEVKNGLAVFGTCAGCIMLANKTRDSNVKDFTQNTLELIDITVERNSYGRQRDSFEAPITIKGIGDDPYPGVFIRAPLIVSASDDCQVLSSNGESIYAVQQGKQLAVTFHPELTDDFRLHNYFLSLILNE